MESMYLENVINQMDDFETDLFDSVKRKLELNDPIKINKTF
jgi:hypothetical protein